MPLIAAKILEGITGGQVNAQQLPIQLALAQLAMGSQRQDETTAFQRQQELLNQRDEMSRASVLQQLALQLGLTTATPEAIAGEVSSRRGKSEAERKRLLEQEQVERKQDRAGTARRSAIQELQASAQIGGLFGQVPGGQVPAEILSLLPQSQSFAQAQAAAQAAALAAQPREDLFEPSMINDLTPEGAQAILDNPVFAGEMSRRDVFRVLARSQNTDPEKAGNLGDAQRILRGFIDQSFKVSMPVTPSDFTMGREDLIGGAVQDLNDMLNDPQFQADFKESTGFSVQQAMPGGRIAVDETDALGALPGAGTPGGAPGAGERTPAPPDARQALLTLSREMVESDPGGVAAVASKLRALATALRSDPTVAEQIGAPGITPEEIEAIVFQIMSEQGRNR